MWLAWAVLGVLNLVQTISLAFEGKVALLGALAAAISFAMLVPEHRPTETI